MLVTAALADIQTTRTQRSVGAQPVPFSDSAREDKLYPLIPAPCYTIQLIKLSPIGDGVVFSDSDRQAYVFR